MRSAKGLRRRQYYTEISTGRMTKLDNTYDRKADELSK
jgi:hypothetical protein